MKTWNFYSTSPIDTDKPVYYSREALDFPHFDRLFIICHIAGLLCKNIDFSQNVFEVTLYNAVERLNQA